MAKQVKPEKPGAAKGGSTPPAAPAAAADDLTAITGIGDVTAKKLADAGIATFAQLAALDAAKQAELDGALDMPGGSDWTAWTAQATKLASPNKTANAGGEQGPDAPPVADGAGSPSASGAGQEGVASPAEGDGPAPDGGDPPEERRGPEGYVVIVTAKAKRRRRAGREFGKHETRIPASELTESELAAIRADPVLELRVEEATDEDESQ